MRKHLYVDNTDLATFGVYCSGQGTFGAPEKEVTTYTVPGRDGLVLGVNERMENIRVVYPCFIYTNFAENMKNLRSFLLSRSGYVKINDDYDTTHFRMGFFEAGIDPDVTEKNNAGRFNLVFNCQPQRWLNSGETEVTKSNVGTTTSSGLQLVNPTLFTAKPLIVVTGNAGLLISGTGYGIRVDVEGNGTSTEITDYTIDCETMQVYSGSTNMASKIGFYKSNTEVGVDAPVLVPGTTTIRKGTTNGSIQLLSVKPRWWEV